MSASTTNAPADGAGGGPARLTAARQVFMDAVQAAFTTMLGKLDDALFELAQSAEGELERGNYFDAIRELRLGRDTIKSRFEERLQACWRSLEQGDGPLQRQFVGQQRHEVMALTAAARRAETECADALRELRDGLALTVGVPDGDELIGPRQVFAAFEAACRDTPADPAVRLVVLKFFERHVGVALPAIYRAVADALAPARLPATAQDLPAVDAQWSPADTSTAPADLDLSALIQRALVGDGRGSEALKLLATLDQHDTPGARSRSASIDLARVATRPVEAATGEPSQQMVLDMVALLFDSLFTDDRVPVSARLLIARLQIPFLRLALRDRAILARRSHLARRFFDQLVTVTRGWHEPLTPQQREVLAALVDSVGEACMDDHRAFAAAAEQALADLRALAAPPAHDAPARQPHRKALLARAEQELAERLRQVGRLPDPIEAFLRSHWLQYLVDCLERHGADASPWRQALATLDALLWSLGPKQGGAQQRLAELRPRLVRRLRQGMDQVGVSMFEQEAFLETLDDILDRAQAGQPVWDWQEESAIEALLGPVPEPVAASMPSVVELGAVPTPRMSQVDASPAPAAVAADEPAEQVVSLDELAAELDGMEVAPLELPAAAAPMSRPEADGALPHAGAEVWRTEPAGAAVGQPMVDSALAAGESVDTSEPSQAPAGVGSLEALLRRRGLKPFAQVEEVEITDRGARI
ncbi:DUF1631 family protein [Immundisolibacter sp.]|uniref:DUF1631 family protein n=1 Tax=Immundisolibacter sp. TaxID=1934948 RepID=UPI00261B0607|nr:DUF1631 family protein [Immundisolibacter sp.]MDD3651671.1 DUF1631 family protein [Immundisolibacter sp.]